MIRKLLDTILPYDSRRRQIAARIVRVVRQGPQRKLQPVDHLRRNHRSIGLEDMKTLENSLKSSYFNRAKPNYLQTERGKADLQDHLIHRLNTARNQIVPWLDQVKSLKGASILEIGCGTGSDVVAFTEQGAEVTSIDIEEGAIDVAKKRCELYGISSSIQLANATQILELFADRKFDFIIFYACLEHMTVPERMKAIADSWKLLPAGNFWCVVDTPNRLWYEDDHTSLLPFFHWLPDELAFEYSRFSPRDNFNDCYTERTEDRMEHFLRRGRGVSFHEFVLAIGSLQNIKVVSYMDQIASPKRDPEPLPARYFSVLSELSPDLHPAFLQPSLHFVLKK